MFYFFLYPGMTFSKMIVLTLLKQVKLPSKVLKQTFGEKIRTMSQAFPEDLRGFGYTFTDEGKLRKIDPKSGDPTDEGFDFNVSNDRETNQRHYEALGEVITNRVYELLEEAGLERVNVLKNVPQEKSTFIFLSKRNLEKPKKLLVLIHGSGVVRAGQWSRSLIINHSLNHGTQIPYIKMAHELGYDVLVTNTNDNQRLVNGVVKPIPGHESPTEHARNVWKQFVIDSNPDSVAIVAHSYGGVVTVDLANKYTDFFKEKVFAIGFTDSVHFLGDSDQEVQKLLKDITRNWVTSEEPLNKKVSRRMGDISCFSAGHTKHEWTSYSCMSALFEFLESKYKDFVIQRSAKKQKLDL